MVSIPHINDRPVPLADQMIAKIMERAAMATIEEKEKVEAMRQKAITHANDPVNWKEAITAPIAGIFFLNHNGFNRTWDPSWSNEISQIMEAGDWRPISQGYALYGDNGDLGDGGHRMAAQAYSGTDLEVFVYYGLSKDDVARLDCGKRRTPADAASLAGVPDAKRKAELLNAAWIYERAAGLRMPVLPANVVAVAEEIKQNNKLLSRSYEIAESSLIATYAPLLGEKAGAKIVAILLRAGWPENRVIELLEEIQLNDFENDKHPLAWARTFIEGERPPVDKTLKPAKETGVVIKAMQVAESGAKTVTKNTIAAIQLASGKRPPLPEYPGRGFGSAE